MEFKDFSRTSPKIQGLFTTVNPVSISFARPFRKSQLAENIFSISPSQINTLLHTLTFLHTNFGLTIKISKELAKKSL